MAIIARRGRSVCSLVNIATEEKGEQGWCGRLAAGRTVPTKKCRKRKAPRHRCRGLRHSGKIREINSRNATKYYVDSPGSVCALPNIKASLMGRLIPSFLAMCAGFSAAGIKPGAAFQREWGSVSGADGFHGRNSNPDHHGLGRRCPRASFIQPRERSMPACTVASDSNRRCARFRGRTHSARGSDRSHGAPCRWGI